MGYGVYGLGVHGSGIHKLGVHGSGLRVWGFGIWVQLPGFRVDTFSQRVGLLLVNELGHC